MDVDENLIISIRDYLFLKTGISYFNNIKMTDKNIMVSCPFHKGGQEEKPSCGIKRFSDEYGNAGVMHCFSCGEKTNLLGMFKKVLGDLYDSYDVEDKFHFNQLYSNNLFNPKQKPLFELPERPEYVKEDSLRKFRGVYHPYLASRGISNVTAYNYDLGYDSINKHITFPIKDEYGRCLGIGRRTILGKQYIYPQGFVKPLYGVYELNYPINYLWIVEGPFNLWSLSQWGKSAVALLGTGTSNQYKQLGKIQVDGYVLALDPDDAGRKGTVKLIEQLLYKDIKKIYVCDLPDGKDVNDLSYEQFKCCECLYYKEWENKYKNIL